MAVPQGFRRLAPGIRCRCIHSRVDEAGDTWCCGGNPPGLVRTDAAPPASWIDIDLEILGAILHLAEHDIRVVRITPSARRSGAVSVFVAGEGLPAGELKASYRELGEQLLLENLRPIDEPPTTPSKRII